MSEQDKNIINKPEELVTSHEQTRAGFISFALEKNRRSTPIIESAKSFKVLASNAKTAMELLEIKEIRPAMITAAGLSDKALKFFSEEDKDKAILGLIENFLEPAGLYFVDEVVYRFLLIKGDSLGGSMRNLVGALAQQKLIRALLSNLSISGIEYQWLDNKTKNWEDKPLDDYAIEEQLKALTWTNSKGEYRILAFNLNIPIVKNNIDICLFSANIGDYKDGDIVTDSEKIIMLGELKGGIDPAGADEHWKTGNTALNRIRDAFTKNKLEVQTSFIAAAIEKKMADEIFKQLQNNTLSYAANLTIDSQLVNYCSWLLKL